MIECVLFTMREVKKMSVLLVRLTCNACGCACGEMRWHVMREWAHSLLTSFWQEAIFFITVAPIEVDSRAHELKDPTLPEQPSNLLCFLAEAILLFCACTRRFAAWHARCCGDASVLLPTLCERSSLSTEVWPKVNSFVTWSVTCGLVSTLIYGLGSHVHLPAWLLECMSEFLAKA